MSLFDPGKNGGDSPPDTPRGRPDTSFGAPATDKIEGNGPEKLPEMKERERSPSPDLCSSRMPLISQGPGNLEADSATHSSDSFFTKHRRSLIIAMVAFVSLIAAGGVLGGVLGRAHAAPASYSTGKAFDRLAIIWCENTDYDKALGDPNFAYLAKKGITLSNYYGVTHPSQPNYISSISGDNFGMNHDDLTKIPSNVKTVIDLLEDKGITWGEYQEDMPSTGFEGMEFLNPSSHANDYVRKHNPAVSYDANITPDRLAKMKNTTLFQQDLEANKLPQWMFITPNMTSDGHDTSVTTAGEWVRNFMDPLLDNKNFMQNTLVLITFDETHTYTDKNRVLALLLGDAVPQELVGTTDDTFYTHYSDISTVEANWGLHTLGRWDVGANVFKFVAEKTGDKLRKWAAITGNSPTHFLNESYAGPLNLGDKTDDFPVPNIKAKINGRTVLPAIVKECKNSTKKTFYNTGVAIPDGMHPPANWP